MDDISDNFGDLFMVQTMALYYIKYSSSETGAINWISL